MVKESQMIKLTAIQLCSVPDVEANLSKIAEQLVDLTRKFPTKDHQHIVVLPECCLFYGGTVKEQLLLAREADRTQYLLNQLGALAQKFHVNLVAGTVPILTEAGDKFTNSACVFNSQGDLVARYDKIHLFDVDVQDNEQRYCESSYTQAGNQLVVVELVGITLGLSVCYDLRFPSLFQALRECGADVIIVPSAFTRITGKAHWQPLLQARAIENQVYLVAAAQEGVHKNGRETWGHSMIINPWGDIVAQLPLGEGHISALFEQDKIQKTRVAMPIATHNRFIVELKNT